MLYFINKGVLYNKVIDIGVEIMKIKIMALMLLLTSVSANMFANEAYIHNFTGFNFRAEEWITSALVRKDIFNIELPANKVTTIKWQYNPVKKAKFGVTIGKKFVSGILVTPEKHKVSKDRTWYIFADTSRSRDYVRFWLFISRTACPAVPDPAKKSRITPSEINSGAI